MTTHREPRSDTRTAPYTMAGVMLLVAFTLLGYVMRTAYFPSQRVRIVSIPPPEQPVDVGTAPRLGSQTSSVAVIVFSDFICGSCAAFARDVLPDVRRRYVGPGTASVIFRHYPTNEPRSVGLRLAEAAVCAHRQDRFWQFHDQVYRHEVDWSTSDADRVETFIRGAAKEASIDSARFDACLADRPATDVLLEAGDALVLGVGRTPEVLIGTTQPDGTIRGLQRLTAPSLTEVARAIDALRANDQGR